ncbi:MAG: capsule assembly Wzi family protein [Melioribacter sp.]|uniref:capsule assembly Wzi family protein n=1 Tax=Rosettibacter primus TaxID=3111523 RepID=UPI00247F15B9|nr:capsule assembly Wzi family protein [Melioribacter sp.]
MKKIFLIVAVIFLSFCVIYSQQENVPVDHDVYIFLKEMKVKKILDYIHDDNPIMSRAEVRSHLEEVQAKYDLLSATEKKLLKKFQDEFYDDLADSTNTMQFLGYSEKFSKDIIDIFSNKIKFIYAYREEKANLYLEMLGRAMHGQIFKPEINNSELFDIGFRLRGTLFDKLGYNLVVQKGGVAGSTNYATTFDPRLRYNFKFYENIENISNYDFTEGYLRYFTEPIDKMKLSFQIGREKIKLGYGYSSKLVLSGDHPYLDFIKMDFNYGIISFSSLHATTVGEFHEDRSLNYTKFYAYNKLKFTFKNLFQAGIGEAIIYTGRGIDLAYLNPFAFYKFEEMSLQDRDNGVLFLDFQSDFLKNLELQATFFLDENILSHLQDLDLYSNKTAYQIGLFWYSPLSISDLSFVMEYTKIRPYVYSHTNIKNSYTAHSELLGHRIGPNADEICSKLSYNFSEKLRGNFKYQHIRSGENIYDALGNLVFNAGGDALQPFRQGVDPKHIKFLDGERINKDIFTLSFRYEPFREIFFDLNYTYLIEKNITKEKSFYSSYAYLKMTLEF